MNQQSWRMLRLYSTVGSHLRSSLSPNSIRPLNTTQQLIRHYSSQRPDTDHVVVAGAFTKFTDLSDVKRELDSNGVVVIGTDVVMKVLRSFETDPVSATRFFNWVLEEGDGKVVLGSKGYNKMLCILGVHGLVKEFWGVFDLMKKNGFCVLKGVRDNVIERFKADGLDEDVRRLEGVYASGSVDGSVENMCRRICRIVRNEVWGDEVEGKIKGLLNGVDFSSGGLVEMVLESLGAEPMKCLIFFRWVEESGLFKHDERTYNVMARVLGREYCFDRFWKVADDMRKAGYEMEKDTFVVVFETLSKKKMVKDAVDLYEYAIAGANKPSADDLTFLLRKIAVGKSVDIDLFSRAVKAYTSNGNVLTNSMFEAVLKALISVGRLGECNKVLKVMEEAGFVPTGAMPSKIAYRLSSSGKHVEASQLLDMLEVSGCTSDPRTWTSLIEGHCLAGDLKNANDTFQKMVTKEDIASVDYAFELLANAYCQKNSAVDASKHLLNLVSEREFKPRHTTYKLLISKLLVQGGFKEALDLLSLMKTHGFPPFIEPCIEYISRSGNSDDALAFLKAMTSNRFPSKVVFLHLFEAFFKARRQNEAHDLLSKCPSFIRNHADVLNLFYVKRSGGASDAAPVAA